MIYTCTLNTAIDMFIEMEDFLPDKVNRSIYDEFQPNGKGVNISIILKKLGVPSTAIGYIAGFSGHYIQDELNQMNIDTDFTEVDGVTRINAFVKSNQGEYKIVNGGPEITDVKIDELITKIAGFTKDDVLFVSGSLPKGVNPSILVSIAKHASDIGFRLILDISHPILSELVHYRPYLIKPNDEELQALFPEEELDSEQAILRAAQKLVDQGCQNILVSLGGEGAYFVNKDTMLYCPAPKGEVVNTACSGDTMLATFYSTLQTSSPEAALKKAVAAGSSTAFRSGLTDFEDVDQLMQNLKVQVVTI
ncbi:tagatose-6-phosphate kinase [Oceanobacillus oncorhynchi subsp. incaldanensis]|uniref:Tagatose-6-phosphate kinase n=2 Tax=Oceanobacillus TaxID=182709 RepID=A0A0A1MLE7_9BACI|nr:1-phosphofructokinase [Oceanobacillus oncorhynchi]MDM8099070.1 1-phosphofructokinase [Oceanobacillus oncorhynchi]GIO20208.1 tagatose-6-phosphate kinase [Oceanobacillus oncorhynchi subsp. incaldanensis]CEI80512.1 Tagatose-6-phosphate kinase [Oceanobacillus oncorhynchi]